MALVHCRECGKGISDSADECLWCGARMKKAKRGVFGFLVKWAFVLFNFIMIANFIVMWKINPPPERGLIGYFLGMMMFLGFWALVNIILGIMVFLTRPSRH